MKFCYSLKGKGEGGRICTTERQNQVKLIVNEVCKGRAKEKRKKGATVFELNIINFGENPMDKNCPTNKM